MKILGIVHAFPPEHNSGAEWMMHDMMQYMMQRGHECYLWVTKYPYRTFNGIESVDHSFIPEADMLWTHLGQTGKALNYSRAHNKPLLHVVHNTQRYGILTGKKPNVYHAYNTYYTLDALKDHYKNPYVVYHPSVDIDHYNVETTREYVSLINLNPSKGGHILQQLAKRMPDISFLGVKGSYGDQVVDYPKNVRLRENTSEIQSVYKETGIVIMPSNYESYGRVAVEAMCSGIPVIANPTPGLIESCGTAGYFADRNDIDAWVYAIRDVLKNYDYWSKKAKLRAEDLHEQSAHELDRLERFCADIVSNQ